MYGILFMFATFKRKFFVGMACACLVLTGCAHSFNSKSMWSTSSIGSAEYFAESKYGTKASPRLDKPSTLQTIARANYVKLGKPYKVGGRWYYPKKEYSNFTQKGKASWYGSAFQGRLTANGEVYDMNALSAAHPTMPLPSYARVTNLSNGSSIIVRVNDRGPYVANRIIDLSKRAAEALDYKDDGLAKVKISYLGLAPLHVDDSSYLVASYQAGGSNARKAIMLAKKETQGTLDTFVAQDKKGQAKDNLLAMLPEIGPVIQFKH